MKTIEIFNLWKDSTTQDIDTQTELKKIEQDLVRMEELFSSNLTFGTGGLRAKMGVGSNRMNVYTVRRTTQGIASSINKLKLERKVAIAYDTRNNSKLFAENVANVFIANNIEVFLFDSFTPTPELSFAVRYLECSFGIVITASHNPPIYNGYKVYGSDGGQITLEQANQILNEIKNIELFNDVKYSFNQNEKNELFHLIGENIDQEYLSKVKALFKREYSEVGLKVVYSSLHGTGIKLIPSALNSIGIKYLSIVKEQAIPDGNFPTVKSPNPEESDALELAIKQAYSLGADIVLATDPDCDRLGVSARTNSGEFEALNGNQIGALLVDFLTKSSDQSEKKRAIIKTIVTSELGALIAQDNDCDVFNTLTGFKFIGEKVKQFEMDDSHTFVFGYEESYGYLSGTFVRDKDAVIAACLVAGLASELKQYGLTLFDRLDQLQQKHGYFSDNLVSIELSHLSQQEKLKSVINKLSDIKFTSKLFSDILCLDDFGKGLRFDLNDIQGEPLFLPKESVVKIHFIDKSWFAIRPSGTEPKMKLYFSCTGKTKLESNNRLNQLKSNVLAHFNEMMNEHD